MDWLDLLAVQGTLKSLLQHHSSKPSILWPGTPSAAPGFPSSVPGPADEGRKRLAGATVHTQKQHRPGSGLPGTLISPASVLRQAAIFHLLRTDDPGVREMKAPFNRSARDLAGKEGEDQSAAPSLLGQARSMCFRGHQACFLLSSAGGITLSTSL